jgi:hypothetical protein
MKRKICDPCHEKKKKKVVKNVQFYVTTSEESEDTTTQTLDDQKIDPLINEGRTANSLKLRTAPFKSS